jgi:hypothetical protein
LRVGRRQWIRLPPHWLLKHGPPQHWWRMCPGNRGQSCNALLLGVGLLRTTRGVATIPRCCTQKQGPRPRAIGSALIKVQPTRQKQSLDCQMSNDRLGRLALLRHACHVTVRFKRDVMGALFECLRAAFVEDHLFADVVIALFI